jgi:hypothetical protein
MQLSDRELATVLAALRYWQDEMRPGDVPLCYPEHFEDVTPLTTDEIDSLCERLNGGIR